MSGARFSRRIRDLWCSIIEIATVQIIKTVGKTSIPCGKLYHTVIKLRVFLDLLDELDQLLGFASSPVYEEGY